MNACMHACILDRTDQVSQALAYKHVHKRGGGLIVVNKLQNFLLFGQKVMFGPSRFDGKERWRPIRSLVACLYCQLLQSGFSQGCHRSDGVQADNSVALSYILICPALVATLRLY